MVPAQVGGGAVARLCATTGYRILAPGAAALEDGTAHFRAFPAVAAGFAELARVGGVAAIAAHAGCLAAELRGRLLTLRRGDERLCDVYGDGAGGPTPRGDLAAEP